MEGFWVEKDHMTYYTYLFPQFHHWCDAKHDFSCSDSTTTKKKSLKKIPKNAGKGDVLALFWILTV